MLTAIAPILFVPLRAPIGYALVLLFASSATVAPRVFAADPSSDADVSAQARAIITSAGNAESDAARLNHLRLLADQVERDGIEVAGLDALIAFVERWIDPTERLDFFDREIRKELDYDFGLAPDSALNDLAGFYVARMLVWANFEYSDIYPFPELREQYLGKARELFESARVAFPENRLIPMYLGEPIPPAKELEAPDGAPKWAVAQRAGLERLTDVIDWWIDNRLQPSGEYGGGWGDDCEMWRHWAPVLIGFDYAKANWAQGFLSERLLEQPHLAGGYHNRLMDVEHTAEDISDALTPMMHIAPDNPEWSQHSLRLVDLAEDLWMGRNERGLLQFKSTYFTVDNVDLTPARAVDTVYHLRALQPALLYWQRTDDPRVGELVAEWMKTWVAATASAERGKPAGIVPTAIHWPEGHVGGVGEKWWLPENYESPLYDFPSAMSLMANTLLQTYQQTGDESYLEPIRSMAAARLEWSRSKPEDPKPGSRMWAAARLDQLIGVLAKYRLLTGDGQFDELLNQEEGSPYAQFLLTKDWQGISDSLGQLARVLSVNFPSYTSEVRYTDRVFRFPLIYQPGWIQKEGASDLLLIEAGVLAMGLNRIHMLYNSVTGDPGDPLYFPLNAVRWRTPPRDIAAMVTRSAPRELEARLYHFGEKPREFECELYLLEPGVYSVSVVEVEGGRVLSSQEMKITADQRRHPLVIPGQTEVTLTISRTSTAGL